MQDSLIIRGNEIKMSFGRLKQILSVIGNDANPALLALDVDVQEKAIRMFLSKYVKKDEDVVFYDTDNPIVDLDDLTLEEADLILNFVQEHVFDFFIRFAKNIQQMQSRQEKVEEEMKSIAKSSEPTSNG